MVKNTKGGSGHKRLARKHQHQDTEEKIRYPGHENELVGRVSKLLGNRMCYVRCSDGIERLAHIRKKFSGRNKKMNYIGIDTYVLIGLREWEKRKEKEQCDIIEVYTPSQDMVLRSYFKDNDDNIYDNDDDCGFVFEEL